VLASPGLKRSVRTRLCLPGGHPEIMYPKKVLRLIFPTYRPLQDLELTMQIWGLKEGM